ncbi:TspO/MBR-related protein [Filobasidium floriforme]|uniref:TspO/MBR-related protein n=1 Tax=Filobasidium floriforme TaxID=5210 RepID=UPI001E8E956D|nr:TspO/MBR-related protein [Filobasidium floriforme]KAH8080128.1 TspO/MBR-related protein [Filobasidium floriforme]
MGYASHLAWKAYDNALTPKGTEVAVRSLELYYAQLGLNLLWTPLFFGLHRKGLALVDILALTGTSAWWAKSLFEIGPVRVPGVGDLNPGWLAVPYLGWLSYATYLNLGYLVLNQDDKPKKY